MGRWRSLVVVITVAILALPGTVRADGVASAIYGVGVQIGLVELGALEDADPAFLVRALRLARTSATASGCISTTEIDRLITAMSAAERSRPLYERPPIASSWRARSSASATAAKGTTRPPLVGSARQGGG